MRVGVTGMYASGKGTVCAMFANLGADVVDTDIIARDVVKPGTIGLDKIIATFGKEFLQSNGNLDRPKLASLVFSNADQLNVLNRILHPLILEHTLKASANSDSIIMINAPVLFEAGFNEYMDKIIVVTSSLEQSISRGILRDQITSKSIKDRISHQISLNEKIQYADYVIDNSGSIENTLHQVEIVWKTLLRSKMIDQ